MARNNNRRGAGYGFGMNLTGPGTIFTLGFIGIALGLGILLTRGITPKSTLTDPGETGDVEMIIEAPDPNNKSNLQLKTIKFRECGSTVTIDMLLDRSGSMDNRTPTGETKISRLKEAVLSLLEKAHDTSIIGIQSFDSGSILNDIPISYYKDVKADIPVKLKAMSPGGSTPTHDALDFSLNVLREAIPKFPKERKFNFILISDGAPVPATQDPRLFTPNPADEIKALGVEVYTLGIFSVNQTDPALSDLLKSIASKPENYYAANTGDDVKELLKQISNRICSQEISPTP